MQGQATKRWTGSALLIASIIGTGIILAAWKQASITEAEAAAASQPEPIEMVSTAVATSRQHRQTATSIGTVLALRSIELRNELSGTVRHVNLTPGQIVGAGTVLVALDVSVEQAELKALEAQAALAETVLGRVQRLYNEGAEAQTVLDRATRRARCRTGADRENESGYRAQDDSRAVPRAGWHLGRTSRAIPVGGHRPDDAPERR